MRDVQVTRRRSCSVPASPDDATAVRSCRRFPRLDLTPARGLMLQAAEDKACQFFEIYSDRNSHLDNIVVDDRDYGLDAEKENTCKEVWSPSKPESWCLESPGAATADVRKCSAVAGDCEEGLPRAGSELQLKLMRRRTAIEASMDSSSCADGLASPRSKGPSPLSPWGARIPEDVLRSPANQGALSRASSGNFDEVRKELEEKSAHLEHQAVAFGRKASEFAKLLGDLRAAERATPGDGVPKCLGWSPLSSGKAEAEPPVDSEARKRKEEAFRSQISKLKYDNRKLQEAKERSEKALQQAQVNASADLQKCQLELGEERLENQRLTQVVKQLEAEIVRLGSHSNPKQKIHYLQQVKEENTVLRKELDRAKRLLGRQRSGCSTPRSPEDACKLSTSACSTPRTPGHQLRKSPASER